jgi:hypothetical protein
MPIETRETAALSARRYITERVSRDPDRLRADVAAVLEARPIEFGALNGGVFVLRGQLALQLSDAELVALVERLKTPSA